MELFEKMEPNLVFRTRFTAIVCRILFITFEIEYSESITPKYMLFYEENSFLKSITGNKDVIDTLDFLGN